MSAAGLLFHLSFTGGRHSDYDSHSSQMTLMFLHFSHGLVKDFVDVIHSVWDRHLTSPRTSIPSDSLRSFTGSGTSLWTDVLADFLERRTRRNSTNSEKAAIKYRLNCSTVRYGTVLRISLPPHTAVQMLLPLVNPKRHWNWWRGSGGWRRLRREWLTGGMEWNEMKWGKLLQRIFICPSYIDTHHTTNQLSIVRISCGKPLNSEL